MGRFRASGPRIPPNTRRAQPQMIKVHISSLEDLSKNDLECLLKDDVDGSLKALISNSFATGKKRKNKAKEGEANNDNTQDYNDDDDDGYEMTTEMVNKKFKKILSNRIHK